jgi:uncharacterized membrane protein SirB2
LESFYPQIKAVHIGAVVLSGSLFAFRGLMLNVFEARWTRALPLRVGSWIIDTVLLTAALMLTAIVDQYPFVHGWLTTKVALLVVYIGLGSVALRPQRPRKVRLLCWGGALAVFLFIATVARAHHPFGALAGMTGP